MADTTTSATASDTASSSTSGGTTTTVTDGGSQTSATDSSTTSGTISSSTDSPSSSTTAGTAGSSTTTSDTSGTSTSGSTTDSGSSTSGGTTTVVTPTVSSLEYADCIVIKMSDGTSKIFHEDDVVTVKIVDHTTDLGYRTLVGRICDMSRVTSCLTIDYSTQYKMAAESLQLSHVKDMTLKA